MQVVPDLEVLSWEMACGMLKNENDLFGDYAHIKWSAILVFESIQDPARIENSLEIICESSRTQCRLNERN